MQSAGHALAASRPATGTFPAKVERVVGLKAALDRREKEKETELPLALWVHSRALSRLFQVLHRGGKQQPTTLEQSGPSSPSKTLFFSVLSHPVHSSCAYKAVLLLLLMSFRLVCVLFKRILALVPLTRPATSLFFSFCDALESL